jgi:hypothetical protein
MGQESGFECHVSGCHAPVAVSDESAVDSLMRQLHRVYDRTTAAGEDAAQYWADISVHSKSPLAPLANVPGVFAALWTPSTAPKTALTLGTAWYGFASIPRHLVHFTTEAGAEGILAAGGINASRIGLFGPGVYMARLGPPINLFIRAASRIPINVATPGGTVRIIPYLVYVRWGLSRLPLP